MKYTFDDFQKIIQKLRSENGCPWDREQTHESLRPCMIEEAYELISSIRIYQETGSPENLREELGDVLLQVAMHSEIAEEEGLFTMEDVIQDVAEKMIRRHPHVFGQVQVENSNEVLRNWEEIKRGEKEGKDWALTPLREIPQELPALIRGVKVQKKINKLYGGQETDEVVLERLGNFILELKKERYSEDKETYRKSKEEIFGDILLEITKLAASYKLNPEQILFDKIEERIKEYDE